MRRRDFLERAAAVAAALLAGRGGAPGTQAASAPLRTQAAAQGLLYGSALGWPRLTDADYLERFGQECGILVPENELKWLALRPTPDTYDFSRADALAAYAADHGMLFRGHTLVWHHSLPSWFDGFADPSNAASLLEYHIATVVGHYAGAVHSWDVLNEVVNPADGRADGLRHTPWLELLGPELIETPVAVTVLRDGALHELTLVPAELAG